MCEKVASGVYLLHIKYVGFLHEFCLRCQLKTSTKYSTSSFMPPLYVAHKSISPAMVLGYRISCRRVQPAGKNELLNKNKTSHF